jgi:hypothetical protein
VVNNVPVGDEAPLMTSRISRFAGDQSFGGAHGGRVCVRVFIGVSVDKASVVTSRISRFAGDQSFGGAHRGRICVRIFIRVSPGTKNAQAKQGLRLGSYAGI